MTREEIIETIAVAICSTENPTYDSYGTSRDKLIGDTFVNWHEYKPHATAVLTHLWEENVSVKHADEYSE